MISQYLPIYNVSNDHDNNMVSKLIDSQTNESINPHYANMEEILNSRRWKLVSRIQLPEPMKKIAKKLIK